MNFRFPPFRVCRPNPAKVAFGYPGLSFLTDHCPVLELLREFVIPPFPSWCSFFLTNWLSFSFSLAGLVGSFLRFSPFSDHVIPPFPFRVERIWGSPEVFSEKNNFSALLRPFRANIVPSLIPLNEIRCRPRKLCSSVVCLLFFCSPCTS